MPRHGTTTRQHHRNLVPRLKRRGSCAHEDGPSSEALVKFPEDVRHIGVFVNKHGSNVEAFQVFEHQCLPSFRVFEGFIGFADRLGAPSEERKMPALIGLKGNADAR